jgi:hypothetical protein
MRSRSAPARACWHAPCSPAEASSAGGDVP